MGRASSRTKLPLATWAKIMGINPLHFCQVHFGDPTEACQQPWMQHEWQDADRVGREAVARAIAEAEAQIEAALGCRLAPTWEVQEWHKTAQPYDPELINVGNTDLRGFDQSIRLDWECFISGGIEAKTVIAAAHAIVWSDADGDGYKETGTISHATTVTDPCEIALYYPGKNGASEWEIRPITVSIAGGVATITFRRELAVLEALQESITADGVDGADDTKFLGTVDVYRHYNDPSIQANLFWENGCDCGSLACATCSLSTQTGCLNIRGNPRLSLVSYTPATWDAVDEEFDAAELAICRQPDVVTAYYRAGLHDMTKPCYNSEMPDQWARAVAYFAASKLDRPICECAAAQVDKWRVDLAFQTGAEQLSQYQVTERMLNNPFGTMRGAVEAWRQVLQAGGGARGISA